MKGKSVAQLLKECNLENVNLSNSPLITNVAYDSRQVDNNSLFVAITGFHVDGHDYIEEAVKRGARAIIAQKSPHTDIPVQIPVVIVENSRAFLAKLAAAINNFPSRGLTIAGITGTDGKTTVTTMLHAAWQASHIKAASLSTIDMRIGDTVMPNQARQTTLEAPEIQTFLRQLVEQAYTHAAIETSSHALELNRVDTIEYRLAVYTKVTSEHLDFHKTREEYLRAKLRLAQQVNTHKDAAIVCDYDDEFAYPHLAELPGNQITYSGKGNPKANVVASSIVSSQEGIRFQLHSPWGSEHIALQIAGSYNATNACAALAAACVSGANFADALTGLQNLASVSGRMEQVNLGQPFSVIIDYAHTAEALEKVLSELRDSTSNSLWVVFGSGGERDVDKRTKMGQIAAQCSDQIVLTNEDPRDEDGNQIINQIATGVVAELGKSPKNLHLIVDRARAIDYAISNAKSGDTILLAGKGHESCILLEHGKSIPWNERQVAEAALHRLNTSHDS